MDSYKGLEALSQGVKNPIPVFLLLFGSLALSCLIWDIKLIVHHAVWALFYRPIAYPSKASDGRATALVRLVSIEQPAGTGEKIEVCLLIKLMASL